MGRLQAILDAIWAGARAGDLESSTVDFKRDGRSADDTVSTLAATLACLANAAGGSVVVGVADGTSGPDAFVGTRLDADLTKRQVFERTDPHLVVSAQQVTYGGVHLLVLSTPPSAAVHAVGGRYTERIGTSCHPMSADRIAQVLTDRRGEDWTARDSGVPITAVDAMAMDRARSILSEHPDPRSAARARRPDADLLRSLGVVTPAGTLTTAGALLVGPAHGDEGGMPQISYIYRSTPSGPLVVNEQLTRPLLATLSRVLELIDTRTDRTPVNLAGGVQVQLADLPETVVREAVVNAVMHRDYRTPDRIVVEHSPARLVVTSPGGLMAGVTADRVLTAPSRLRNVHLAGVVRSLGLAETAGTGVDRMFAVMARTGLATPIYDVSPAQVSVTLLGGPPSGPLVRYVATLPPRMRDDVDAMLTLRALLSATKLTAADIAPTLQRVEDDAEQVLAGLAHDPDGFLEPTRESLRWSHPQYRLRPTAVTALGPALPSRRKSVEDSEQRVLALVREAGQLTPGMVRVLLGVQPATVSRLLRDMIERQLLVRTSRSARGPGVTYGPGPKMPKNPRRRSSARSVSDPGATMLPMDLGGTEQDGRDA